VEIKIWRKDPLRSNFVIFPGSNRRVKNVPRDLSVGYVYDIRKGMTWSQRNGKGFRSN